jgi:NAD-dependent DNA ligase
MKAFKKELLGIPGIGPEKVKLIKKAQVTSMNQLASLSWEELLAIRGIGPHLAESISSYVSRNTAPAAESVAEPEVDFWEALKKEFRGLGQTLAEIGEYFVVALGDRCFGVAPAGAGA